MLVLTRKKGESLLIGEGVEITIIDISEGKVRIAINAPREVQIIRSEIKKGIEDENKSASSAAAIDQLKKLKKTSKK